MKRNSPGWLRALATALIAKGAYRTGKPLVSLSAAHLGAEALSSRQILNHFTHVVAPRVCGAIGTVNLDSRLLGRDGG